MPEARVPLNIGSLPNPNDVYRRFVRGDYNQTLNQWMPGAPRPVPPGAGGGPVTTPVPGETPTTPDDNLGKPYPDPEDPANPPPGSPKPPPETPETPGKPPPETPETPAPPTGQPDEGFTKGYSANQLEPTGGKFTPEVEPAPDVGAKAPQDSIRWGQVLGIEEVPPGGTPGAKPGPAGGAINWGTQGGTWPGGSSGTWGGTGQNVARLTDSISDPRYAVVGGQGGYGLGAVGPRYTGPYWRDVPKVPGTTPPNPSNPTVAPPLSPFNINGLDVNVPPWLKQQLGIPDDGGAKPPPGTAPPPGTTPPPGTKPPGETPPGETPPGAKPGPGGEVPGKPPPTGDPNAPIPGAPNPPATAPPPAAAPPAAAPGQQTTGTPQQDWGGLPPIQTRTAPPAGFTDVTNNLDPYMKAAEQRALSLFGPYWSSPQNFQYALRQELDSKGVYSKRVDDYFNLRLSKPQFGLRQFDDGGQPIGNPQLMNMARFGQGAVQKWAADNGYTLPDYWKSYVGGQDYAAPGLPGGAPPGRMPGTPAPLTPEQRAQVLATAKTKKKGDKFTMNGRTYFLNQNGALVDITTDEAGKRTRITDIHGNPIGDWA